MCDLVKGNAECAENGNKLQEKGHFQVSSWGCRHQQSFIFFVAFTVAYSMRACMGVALVAMTHKEANSIVENITDINGTRTGGYTGPTGFLNALMLVPPYPQFHWSKKIQDSVIASFYWGYMALQIPAGHLAHRLGARFLLLGAMVINGIACLVLPLASYYGGWICTIICRVIQGLSQACVIPGIHTCLGKWAPLEERSRLVAFTYGGQALGTVFGLPLTGFISSSSLGWPGIFRFYAILCGIAALLIWLYAADSPAKHPKISKGERKYIEESVGVNDSGKKHLPVPWLKILRSKGLYAIILGHIGVTWGQVTLYSEVPAFMDKIMGVNIKANGLLTALPFMVMWFTNFFFSWLGDYLIVNKILTVTQTRKLCNTLGTFPPALGLVALAFVPKNIYVVETILVLICAFKIAVHVGFQVNHIDISPNFAGTMMSVSNFMSNLVGSFAPIVTGFILTDVSSEYLWMQVFFVTAGVYVVTNTFYIALGTAEKAEWNDVEVIEKLGDELEYIPMMKSGDVEKEEKK